MNAERLLDHYERIADAPDAIQRLRRFVLDLAMRGKLVPQDPSDEPASELLKRIAAEKARLVKTGEFREPTSFVRIDRKDLPLVPATHWAWARLIDIARPSYGFAFPSARFNSSKRGMPLIRIRDISSTNTEAYFDGDYDPAYLVTAGDYLVGMDGDFNLRRWKGENGLLNQRVMRINGWRCGVNPEFIKLPLQFVLDYLHGETSLTTVKHLSAKQVNGIEIPLPPLPEQHRIVAKVDELMALSDRLEAACTEREATRDRFATASLARLNVPDPETFRYDARVALDALPALTTRPNQIKHLRQTILNLAVRGKLVPQDANDEPAIEFDLAPVEPPFDIPKSWKWARLHTLGTLKGGGTPSKARDDYWNGPIPWVSPKDMKVDHLAHAQLSISKAAITESAVNLIDAGSILFVVRGMILAHSFPVAVTRVPLTINQDMKALVPKKTEMAEFILRALKGLKPEMLRRVQRSSHGTCRIEGADYSEFLVPVPPLAEQHRIVAKVDQLIALCDRLEASLTTAADTRRRLLDALLAEALAPADKRELEAAE